MRSLFFFSLILFLREEMAPPACLYPTWQAPHPLQCLVKPSPGPDPICGSSVLPMLMLDSHKGTNDT